MNSIKEFEFLLDFIFEEVRLDGYLSEQARSLWTAFCIHHDLNVDTAEFDWRMEDLFEVYCSAKGIPPLPHISERFYNWMSKDLV